jgi:hypothetical protein
MTSIIKGNLMNTIDIKDIHSDEGKGAWADIDDETLIEMFSDIIVNNENADIITSEFRFDKTKDAEYYSEKFPGFSDEVYHILEQEQNRLDSHSTILSEVPKIAPSAELRRCDSATKL